MENMIREWMSGLFVYLEMESPQHREDPYPSNGLLHHLPTFLIIEVPICFLLKEI
jgi:hypothetical protein